MVCEHRRNPGAQRDALDTAERNADIQRVMSVDRRLVDDSEFPLVAIGGSFQEREIPGFDIDVANIAQGEVPNVPPRDTGLLFHRLQQFFMIEGNAGAAGSFGEHPPMMIGLEGRRKAQRED